MTDFDLTNMCVTAILVHAFDARLQQMCAQWLRSWVVLSDEFESANGFIGWP